ncbi:PREDICTED: uncharacterized protein LOC105558941 [Vollenhovia emeryi]|uniref:uncharacterized protein LOC105558941 n=1 Tax=Vollenhovia emeryi TaxID=411798 RepID=UPI0005F4C66F|nr:PREDICTED: uncharacterized protein LOC105558941 [Vollenhovia emeryi]
MLTFEMRICICNLLAGINRPTFNSMPVYNPEKVKKICQSGEKSVVSVCASKNFEAEMLPSSNINECKSNERTIKETLCSNESSSVGDAYHTFTLRASRGHTHATPSHSSYDDPTDLHPPFCSITLMSGLKTYV